MEDMPEMVGLSPSLGDNISQQKSSFQKDDLVITSSFVLTFLKDFIYL